MRELEFGKYYIQSSLVILLPKYFTSFLRKQKHAHNFESEIFETVQIRGR